MFKTRILPVLLLDGENLVKGEQFKKHKYIGDPINTINIFNEKNVDELIFLDISVTKNKLPPNYKFIKEIADEAFMPFCYGGGITSVNQIEKIFKIGVEKVLINTAAYYTPNLIKDASHIAGSQSIVVSVDVKKKIFGGYDVYIKNGTVKIKENLIDYLRKLQDLGAGEIVITSIDREGTGIGYDIELLQLVSDKVNIPVIALGGAKNLNDFYEAKKTTNVSGLAAGNMFVFYGKHKAVLISYPEYSELKKLLYNLK